MVEEPSPPVPPAEESIEAETDTALEPENEPGESTPERARDAGFVCDCEERMRSACKGLPFYEEDSGKRYCVLHFPADKNIEDFHQAAVGKIYFGKRDFTGVWFPAEFICEKSTFRDVDFSFAVFNEKVKFYKAKFKGIANFTGVTFHANVLFDRCNFESRALFTRDVFNERVSFHSTFSGEADFEQVNFRSIAVFSGSSFSSWANFGNSVFSNEANFRATGFSNAYFRYAAFGGVTSFNLANFSDEADFTYATFKDRVRFEGNAVSSAPIKSMNLEYATTEKPDHVSFHSVMLHHHWFVNVDARGFDFANVEWSIDLIKEIEALHARRFATPHPLLAIAYRRLAENAETNNRYEEASRFRYWAMDLARRTKWKGWTLWKTDWLHMLYWAVSGYGERILRALGALAAVWFVFVLLYTRVGFVTQAPSNQAASSVTTTTTTIEDRIGQPLEFSRALTYSLAVMSLQKPDPKPLTGTAQTLVLLETILGPVQAALLALAIRRKFMR